MKLKPGKNGDHYLRLGLTEIIAGLIILSVPSAVSTYVQIKVMGVKIKHNQEDIVELRIEDKEQNSAIKDLSLNQAVIQAKIQ